MISSLDFVPMESEKPVNFGQNRIRVPHEMLIEIDQITINKSEFLLGNSFEHVFVVFGEEKKLTASASRTLHDVEHLFCILPQLKGRVYLG